MVVPCCHEHPLALERAWTERLVDCCEARLLCSRGQPQHKHQIVPRILPVFSAQYHILPANLPASPPVLVHHAAHASRANFLRQLQWNAQAMRQGVGDILVVR